jgi:hypothetical protein
MVLDFVLCALAIVVANIEPRAITKKRTNSLERAVMFLALSEQIGLSLGGAFRSLRRPPDHVRRYYASFSYQAKRLKR